MKKSAGILLFRRTPALQVFLVHMGGPFWKNKEKGAWTIPKGEIDNNAGALATARKELAEETGLQLGEIDFELDPIRQKSGKIVYAFAVEGDANPDTISSNTFEIEWPPKSGTMKNFPEVDKAGWFTPERAAELIITGQEQLIDQLQRRIGAN